MRARLGLALLILLLAACDSGGSTETTVQVCHAHPQSDGSKVIVCMSETPPP